MELKDMPIGIMRNDELLNALLAVWKTQYSITRRIHTSEFAQGYQIGFEEGLDAVAQAAGLAEIFEAGKATYQVKVQAKLKIDLPTNGRQAQIIDFVE